MQESIQIDFNKTPSYFATLVQAFSTRKRKMDSGKTLARINASGRNMSVNKQHLKEFNRICQIQNSSELQILYPFTLAYGYIMRILCRKEMPFSLFKVLNTRNSIRQYRRIGVDEVFDIECHNSDIRFVRNGFEIDIDSAMLINGETVWENTTTYLIRMHHKDSVDYFIPPNIQPIENVEEIDTWYLKAKDRFRFARISGDTNGIHYGKWYAKSFGFQRDFAQPIRIAAKCVDSIKNQNLTFPAKLDFFLKGPVYYNNTLVMKSTHENDIHQFDLYCGTNARPCIIGILSDDKLSKNANLSN